MQTLKVVIADDEARVCKLIQLLPDWDALGIVVVGTASNGLEALDLVRQHRPDILITDMRMPGCHGLELIGRVKAEFPAMEIVIISGYAHFEYAQTAIKYGVSDYLLKPIKKDELNATLENLGSRCRQRASETNSVERLKQDMVENTNRLRMQLVWDLAAHKLDRPTAQQLWDQYRVRIGEGLIQVFGLKLDYNMDSATGKTLEIIQQKAEKSFMMALSKLCNEVVWFFEPPWGCGILNYSSANRERVRKVLRDCLNQLTAQRALFGPIEFTLSLGKDVKYPDLLPLAFTTAREGVYERLTVGTGRLLTYADTPPAMQSQKLLEKYTRTIDRAIESLDLDVARAAVSELEREAGHFTHVRGQELLDLVINAGKAFLMRLDAQSFPQALKDFTDRCDQCTVPAALFRHLTLLQNQHLNQFLQQRENDKLRPVRMAKQYAQQHFTEPITLEDVCAATGFSTSYFSALFKKETGEGFSKYLTQLRIERAKELLQGTDAPISDICIQVGYNDIKHFAQTFKKATNLSPGQYRKLYG